MPTINLQGFMSGGRGQRQKEYTVAVTVAASPGRVHFVTTNGVSVAYERIGVDASGNETYRDQRRPAGA